MSNPITQRRERSEWFKLSSDDLDRLRAMLSDTQEKEVSCLQAGKPKHEAVSR